jgi:hypothetical protein
MGLKIHPKLRAIAKVQAEPKRRVGRNAPPIVDDLGDAIRRNADGLSELVFARDHTRQGILPSTFHQA